MISVTRGEGDRWVRIDTGQGLAISLASDRRGGFTSHLDFDYGRSDSDLSGLIHYEPDPKQGLEVDRSGYTEVEAITGDTEVYSQNPDQFLFLLRQLVERAEQELTGLQEATQS